MTGFGKAVRQLNGQTLSVEVSSVNHRFLDSTIRMPSEWSAMEAEIRDALSQRITRGKVTFSVNRKRGAVSASSVKFDADVARRYIEAAQEIGHIAGQYEPMSVNTLAQLNGVFYYADDEEEIEKIRGVLLEALQDAIAQFDSMRTEEGRALLNDLRMRVDLIRERLAKIEARLPELNELYKTRLKQRLAELNEDANIAEERIAVEVALMADRGDVTEETVRLKTHLDHLLALSEANEPAGRKLNFLAQELQREINTLGAKIRDGEVSREVLEIKSEVEKIREQVQNVE